MGECVGILPFILVGYAVYPEGCEASLSRKERPVSNDPLPPHQQEPLPHSLLDLDLVEAALFAGAVREPMGSTSSRGSTTPWPRSALVSTGMDEPVYST